MKIYESNLSRLLNRVNYYFSLTQSHTKNIFLIVNQDLHFLKSRGKILACSELDFLFNLSNAPEKAYLVLTKLKTMLEKWAEVKCIVEEDYDYYFMLMRFCIESNFRNDFIVKAYLENLIDNLSSLNVIDI